MKKMLSLLLALTLVLGACGSRGNEELSGPGMSSELSGEAQADSDAERTGEEKCPDMSGEAQADSDAARTGAEESTEPHEKNETGTETSAAAAYPLTLTDQAGRQVTLRKRPERLISGYYISTSAVIALGAADRLVGIEAKAESRPIYRLAAPRLLELPSVGTAKNFSTEGVLALEPELVILPLKLQAAALPLESFGLTVLFVDPESQEGLKEMITLLGAALDAAETAAALLGSIEAAEALMEGAGGGPSVYLAGNSSLLGAAGGDMYQSDLLRLAGAVSVTEALHGKERVTVGYEQLLLWDPEWIVLPSDAAYSPESVAEDSVLSDCRAVREGHIVQLPGNIEAWDSPVPGGVFGALWLASRFYPDRFAAGETEALIRDFYGEYYGFDCSSI